MKNSEDKNPINLSIHISPHMFKLWKPTGGLLRYLRVHFFHPWNLLWIKALFATWVCVPLQMGFIDYCRLSRDGVRFLWYLRKKRIPFICIHMTSVIITWESFGIGAQYFPASLEIFWLIKKGDHIVLRVAFTSVFSKRLAGLFVEISGLSLFFWGLLEFERIFWVCYTWFFESVSPGYLGVFQGFLGKFGQYYGLWYPPRLFL